MLVLKHFYMLKEFNIYLITTLSYFKNYCLYFNQYKLSIKVNFHYKKGIKPLESYAVYLTKLEIT